VNGLLGYWKKIASQWVAAHSAFLKFACRKPSPARRKRRLQKKSQLQLPQQLRLLVAKERNSQRLAKFADLKAIRIQTRVSHN
jgi:hypothetical protein